MKVIYIILSICCLTSCKQSSKSQEEKTGEVEKMIRVEDIPKDWYALTELIDNEKDQTNNIPQEKYKEVIFKPCDATNQEYHFEKEKNEWKLILYIGQEAVIYKVLNLKMNGNDLIIAGRDYFTEDLESETTFILEDYKINKNKVRWKDPTFDTNSVFITKNELPNFEVVDEQCEDDF